MCAKFMANKLDSVHRGNSFGAGDSKMLEELVTEYFIPNSSHEEELSADKNSESEVKPAVRSLRQTENGHTGNDCIR